MNESYQKEVKRVNP